MITRSVLTTAITALALAAPCPAGAESARLDLVAKRPELEDIAHVQYDRSTRTLYGAVARKLVSINPDNGQITDIATLNGDIAALALGPSTAAIALHQGSSIVLINLDDGSIAAETAVGVDNPELITYDASADSFVVGSPSASDIAVLSIDGTAAATVSLPGPIAGLAVTGRGWIFATAASSPDIYVVDSHHGKSLGRFPVPGCDAPKYPIVDDVERRLYVACRNGLLMGLDSDTGVILARLAIPNSPSDMVLADTGGRDINIVVGTRKNGARITSGRITAAAVADLVLGIDSIRELSGAPGDSVFVLHGQSISHLAHQ